MKSQARTVTTIKLAWPTKKGPPFPVGLLLRNLNGNQPR